MTGNPKSWAWVAFLVVAAACGDDATPPAPLGGGVAPGSGALTVRVEDASASPVRGAEVFVDGVAVGRTDVAGVLEVEGAAPVVDLRVVSDLGRVTWLGVAGRDVRIPVRASAPGPGTLRDVTFPTDPAPAGTRRELRVGFARRLVAGAAAGISGAAGTTCDASVEPCTVSLTLPPDVTQVFGLVVDVGEGGESPLAIGHAAVGDGTEPVILAPVPTVRRSVQLPAGLAETPFETTGVIGVPGLGLDQEGVWVVPVALRSGDEAMLPALEGLFAGGRHWLFARQEGAEGAVAETRVIAGDESTFAPPELLPPPRARADAAGLRWDVDASVLVEATGPDETWLWLDAGRPVDAPGPLSVTAYDLPFAPDSLSLETRVDAERRTTVSWDSALGR